MCTSSVFQIKMTAVLWYSHCIKSYACCDELSTAGNYTIWYQYIVSLYWASATTTSVGYGDIHAHTDLEVHLMMHHNDHDTPPPPPPPEGVCFGSDGTRHCRLWIHHSYCSC